MNRTIDRLKGFFRITKIESKQLISAANLIFVLVILAIAMLQIFFISNIDNSAHNQALRGNGWYEQWKTWSETHTGSIDTFVRDTFSPDQVAKFFGQVESNKNSETFMNISRLISSVTIYSIINRIRLVLSDNSTIDKNRTAFMNFRKNDVLGAKVMADLLLFILPVLIAAIGGPLFIIFAKGGGFSNSDWIARLVSNIVGVLFIYLISTMGMRVIWFSTMKKSLRIVTLTVWLLTTIGWMLAGSIVFGVLSQDLRSWVIDNKYIMAFIPFLNMISPWLVFYEMLDAWMVIPLIIYSLAFTIGIWRVTAKFTKLRLCIQN